MGRSLLFGLLVLPFFLRGTAIATSTSSVRTAARSVAAQTAASASADPTVAENWLAQKACVDRLGHVARIDPYLAGSAFGDACPSGYTIRNLRETDTVPYYKYYRPIADDANLTHYRYTNAYETFDASGRALFVMDRQFEPSNVPNDWYVRQSFYPGSTHWDAYEIHDGWVSNVATRDNTGLNQTFFGNASGTPEPYNGWIDFPTSYLSTIGDRPHVQQTFAPVHGVYWEQSGDAWPTGVPQLSQHNPDTQTTWQLLTGYTFDSGKTMNALVSSHQSRPLVASTDPDSGHMEVWYFTIPYGPTRWEVWSAASCLRSGCSSYIKSSCKNRSATMTVPYDGVNYTYYRTNCVDWEQGVTLAYGGSTVPTLPVPQQNLLGNFHFANDSLASSGSATGWQIGSALRFMQERSVARGDSQNGRYDGLRYAEVSCKTTCSAASSLSQSIAPDGNGAYSFGAEVKASAPGSVEVSLSQLTAAGAVLGTPLRVTQSVDSGGDGSNCSTLGGVENCAVYVGEREHLTLEPGAVKMRVSVVLLTAGVSYDVTDVFLSRL